MPDFYYSVLCKKEINFHQSEQSDLSDDLSGSTGKSNFSNLSQFRLHVQLKKSQTYIYIYVGTEVISTKGDMSSLEFACTRLFVFYIHM
jgi:hypothetical protein